MIEVVAAVIIENGKVLLASRPVDKPPAGWEFPGGKIEPGETAFNALKRELLEELTLTVEPLKILHSLTSDNLTLHFILARRHVDSIPLARENQQFKWHTLSREVPDGLLANDLEFWNFLTEHKINCLD